MADAATPGTPAEAASLLGECAAAGAAVRIAGAGTKRAWGAPARPTATELSTAGLARIVEHNRGDLTVIAEPGVRLRELSDLLEGAGQMLALDPPLGAGNDDGATIGGVLATADSGPLRHRYGAARDLVLGMTVVLSDGSVARAGGKVIKNVAGYDLAKLFTGSFGTLGLIAQVALRLHPRPPTTATVVAGADSPERLAAAASAVAHSPAELQSLDVAWGAGEGTLLARCAGAAAKAEAADVARTIGSAGLGSEVVEDDAGLWAAQRERQRAEADGALVRVSALPTALAQVCDAADAAGGSLVGRAGVGLTWIRLPVGDAAGLTAGITKIREGLPDAACVVLDAPDAVRAGLDPWDGPQPAQALMERVKARFDPTATCNPGVFVGGI